MPVCTLGRSPKVHRTPSPLHRWKDDLTFTGGVQQNPAGWHSVAVAIYGKLIEYRRISRFSASCPATGKTCRNLLRNGSGTNRRTETRRDSRRAVAVVCKGEFATR